MRDLSLLIRENAEPFAPDEGDLGPLLDRIGDAHVVLLGEATHGTSEFYRARARITRELIVRRGFDFVAVEADWPDAARIDDYVLGNVRRSSLDFKPFERFPSWMWRNEDVHDFIQWLRAFNADRPERRVGFHGLDLYSMFTSIAAVLEYLHRIDPAAERLARSRYALLDRFRHDPAGYGYAVLAGRFESAEAEVVKMLREMLDKRMAYAQRDGDRFFDAIQNARVVAGAEQYYRAMYSGSVASWNLRDEHMFLTLRMLLGHYGDGSKCVVWEHNSHVGDARATEMSERGETNVGEMCRNTFGRDVYIVGFGTDHGTVAAASDWDAQVETKAIVPAMEGSYERLFHDAETPACTLHLAEPRRAEVRDELLEQRLERAIGVIYLPHTERLSHYFHASLPRQFDEYVYIDETHAVRALAARPASSLDAPETYPFGL